MSLPSFTLNISLLNVDCTHLVSFTVSVRTHRASCSDLSASSKRCEEAPRRMIEQADPLLQPEKRIKRSSPTWKRGEGTGEEVRREESDGGKGVGMGASKG
jgi:hypothetical protein